MAEYTSLNWKLKIIANFIVNKARLSGREPADCIRLVHARTKDNGDEPRFVKYVSICLLYYIPIRVIKVMMCGELTI